MKEIVRISLDNEMDLILAHKKTMKLSELCGLSASLQTRFATAVSEVARCAIANGEDSYLNLALHSMPGGKKEIVGVLYDKVDLTKCSPEAFSYAKRIITDVTTKFEDDRHKIIMAVKVPYSGLLSDKRIASFVEYFKSEAPLSPYDEIRKKNIQLIELADKLTESESNYRQLTDTLPFLVFSVSKNDKVSVANRSAQKILGNSFKDFSDATISTIFFEDDAERVISSWKNSKTKNNTQLLQARLWVKNQPIWHEITIVPNTDEKENVSGFIVSLTNIHAQKVIEETLKNNQELKEAQAELRRSNEELQLKNKELEQFAYIASHDLQEPLRKIRSFISLASRRITEEQQETLYFENINRAAERMSHLIRDVLNYSTLSIDANYEATDLSVVVQEILHDLEPSIEEKSAIISVEKLPTLHAIPSQMNQLFYNLINNALKFNDGIPQIEISCRQVSAEETSEQNLNGPYYLIQIKDNGIGIQDLYFEKIFSIFQRLHPQTVYQGTGIGLSLCKRIVENHNGIIRLESTVGEGSTFSIYLPKNS